MSVVDGKKGGKQSRFSTLRVFGKFNKNAAPGPPPLPPKDPVYLAARNRSLASLSPESIPASPLSGDQYAASSSSAVSLALSAPTKQRSGLFNFRKNAAVNIEASSPAADDDENISMPWNFQHNMHVDEGLSGLPPSWTTSLQEAGFSDDEIAAIQQRRLADRPRPQSPAVRPHSPAVLRPVPRSTSLPKNQQQSQGHTPASSLASSASVSSAGSSPVPELPRSRGASPKVEYGSPKVEYASPPAPKSPRPGTGATSSRHSRSR
ncbi:hypothetical protein B0H13DRAFT_1141233 [Mycena leptocephala]|nr:hypothetical protein B0H13DRAFT_1141233 [Mycena leptocephala]